MFSMNKTWEWIFRVIAFIVQGSSNLSLYAYGAMHRLHHMHTGTEKDPHSAEQYHGFVGMLKTTRDMMRNYSRILFQKISVPDNVIKQVPKLTAFDKITNNWIVRSLFALSYVAIYVVYAPHWIWFLLLPVQIALGPIHGVIVNWFNHKVGYRNFHNIGNDSTNFEIKIGKFVIPWLFSLIMLGENNHNNHHAKPRVNFAFKWHEWDPVYPFIVLFSWMKIIKIKPAFAAPARRRKEELQAVA